MPFANRLFSTGLLVLLLMGLAAVPAWALNGPETVQQLNQRLAATPTDCVGGNPRYACSGVLVLPMADGHPQPFWHHGSEAEERGSERFYFLREDGYGAALAAKVGYLLQDGFTAAGQEKPYTVVEDGSATSGEVLIENWPQDAPDKLAVQALFYDRADPDSLLLAQRGQRQWFEETGQWLPLVRYDAGSGPGTFGFSQQEQLYDGYQLAARLNARYAARQTSCPDGSAGYYCNGIVLRTVGEGDFHFWNPSPNAERVGGVSFSYFLEGDRATQVLYSKGYVSRVLSAPALTPFKIGCVYPADGVTSNANKNAACTLRKTCQQLGVATLAAWMERYAKTPRESCSFTDSVADLELVLEIRAAVGTIDRWSEVVMLPWPQDIGDELPIEALIFSDRSYYEGSGLTKGRRLQRDYLEQTRRYLHLLKVNFNSSPPFVYNPSDQSKP
ncbi:MAG: hypothetical protein LBJ37_15300 [Paucimonas sp.]|jgi:hypothetical protein|nr:hypothetical protein [Paucimonas sp.]